jgi:hypothetical protein
LAYYTDIDGNVMMNSLYGCLKQIKMSFSKTKQKKVKRVLVWGLVLVGGGKYKEKVE